MFDINVKIADADDAAIAARVFAAMAAAWQTGAVPAAAAVPVEQPAPRTRKGRAAAAPDPVDLYTALAGERNITEPVSSQATLDSASEGNSPPAAANESVLPIEPEPDTLNTGKAQEAAPETNPAPVDESQPAATRDREEAFAVVRRLGQVKGILWLREVLDANPGAKKLSDLTDDVIAKLAADLEAEAAKAAAA